MYASAVGETLVKLADHGWAVGHWEKIPPLREKGIGRSPRHYYELTDAGRAGDGHVRDLLLSADGAKDVTWYE